MLKSFKLGSTLTEIELELELVYSISILVPLFLLGILAVSRDGTARLWDCGSASSIATLVSMSCPINCCRLLSTSYMLQSGSTTCAGKFL